MIRRETANGRRLAATLLAGVMLAAAGCSEDSGGGDQQLDGGSGGICGFDEDDEPEAATEIGGGESVAGSICPVGDRDWYEFELDEARRIVEVSLGYETALTSIQPAYQIWSTSSDGSTEEVVASSSPEANGSSLDQQHCLGEGTYKIDVHDRGDDDTDPRHEYSLELTDRENPDTHEGNDSRETAAELGEGEMAEGYIACRGDRDWFGVQVPDEHVMRVELTSPRADYQPTLEVLDGSGEVLVSETNPQAGGRETNIERLAVVPEGGQYFVRISDEGDDDADAEVPYEVSVQFQSDEDQNEPNDGPGEATELTGGTEAECGESWSTTFEAVGTVGGEKDRDWFEVPLGGCADGLVDAEVDLQSEGLGAERRREINDKLQLRLRMVRPHEPTSCSTDADCDVLNEECDGRLDCRGLGAECDAEQRYCTGAITRCLPGGACGAVQVQREYPCTPSRSQYREGCGESADEPLPNRAAIGTPLPETDRVYFQVSDVGLDGAAPDVPYTLRVRVREETDPNEPNNLYIANDSLFDQRAAGENHKQAREIPVYNCTPSEQEDGAGDTGVAMDAAADVEDAVGSMDADARAVDTDGDGVADATSTDARQMDAGDAGGEPRRCCANSPWTEGAISYDLDVDHFKYDHPCPDGNCVLRLHYEIEGGPVDHVMNVLQEGGSPWYTAAYQCERDDHEAVGPTTVGGIADGGSEPDVCLYAHQRHDGNGGNAHRYGFKIFDQMKSFGDNAIRPSTRDWAPGQRYRVCLEKVAEGCRAPCEGEGDECTAPGRGNRCQ